MEIQQIEFQERLPEFLTLGPEVTGDAAFSMYNLTLKGEWIDNDNFCHRLADERHKDPTGKKGFFTLISTIYFVFA